MPLNKVIFNNNSQNNNTFLKKGTPEGPKPVEQNTTIPIVQSETPQQEILGTSSISVPTIPIGSRPNVLRPNISKNEGSVKYTSPTSNKNKFTSKLLNYVEPYEIGGVRKTAFYSEISTNFKVGFIVRHFRSSAEPTAPGIVSINPNRSRRAATFSSRRLLGIFFFLSNSVRPIE